MRRRSCPGGKCQVFARARRWMCHSDRMRARHPSRDGNGVGHAEQIGNTASCYAFAGRQATVTPLATPSKSEIAGSSHALRAGAATVTESATSDRHRHISYSTG
jgi:hypothetical protein